MRERERERERARANDEKEREGEGERWRERERCRIGGRGSSAKQFQELQELIAPPRVCSLIVSQEMVNEKYYSSVHGLSHTILANR